MSTAMTERFYICPVLTTVTEGRTTRKPKIAAIDDPGREKAPGPPPVYAKIAHSSAIHHEGAAKCLCRCSAADWTNVEADGECVRLASFENVDFEQTLTQLALSGPEITALAAALNTGTGLTVGQVTVGTKLVDILDLAGRLVAPNFVTFRDTHVPRSWR